MAAAPLIAPFAEAARPSADALRPAADDVVPLTPAGAVTETPRPAPVAALSPCCTPVAAQSPGLGRGGSGDGLDLGRHAGAAGATRPSTPRAEPRAMNAVVEVLSAVVEEAAQAATSPLPVGGEGAVESAGRRGAAAAAASAAAAEMTAATEVGDDDEEEEDVIASALIASPSGMSAVEGSTQPAPLSAQQLALEQKRAARKADILKINADNSLSAAQKEERISKVNLSAAVKFLEGPVEAAAKRRKTSQLSYHNREKGVLGCAHYPRACSIKPACCDEWYTCRLCHDAVQSHPCVRREIEEVKCMRCNEEQPVAKACRSCHKDFAAYFCAICRLYDDTPNKPLYHCEKCGICRVGDKNYHCDKCNACVAAVTDKKKHMCLKGSLDTYCPCCKGYLYDSTEKVVFTLCGHAMHAVCLKQYADTSYTCPLCHKELGDMTQLYSTFDREIEGQPMPEEYANHRVVIKCHQCRTSSDVRFHLSYRHRCDVSTCRSYNTYIERQYQVKQSEGGPVALGAAVAAVAGPSAMGGVGGAGGGGDAAQP